MANKGRPPKRSGSAKRKTVVPKPWEPSEIQMEWYRQWTEECMGPSAIAEAHQHSITRFTVHSALIKTAEWLRLKNMDHINTVRQRQEAMHEMICERALKAWNGSVGEVKVTTIETMPADDDEAQADWDSGAAPPMVIKKKVVTEYSHGNPAYLRLVMDACKQIRELWGVNAPVKSDVTVRHAEEIEGMPNSLAYGSRAAAMLAGAEAVRQAALQLQAADEAAKAQAE